MAWEGGSQEEEVSRGDSEGSEDTERLHEEAEVKLVVEVRGSSLKLVQLWSSHELSAAQQEELLPVTSELVQLHPLLPRPLSNAEQDPGRLLAHLRLEDLGGGGGSEGRGDGLGRIGTDWDGWTGQGGIFP